MTFNESDINRNSEFIHIFHFHKTNASQALQNQKRMAVVFWNIIKNWKN